MERVGEVRVGGEGEARGVRVEWSGMVSKEGNTLRNLFVT